MGLINRFLLLLCALALSAAALGVIALCLSVVPHAVVLDKTARLLSRWETIAGAAVAFLLGLYMIVRAFHREAKPEKAAETVVIRSETGEVCVSTDAVSELAEKVAGKVHGVESVKAKVIPASSKKGDKAAVSPTALRLQVEIGGGRNVAAISDAIRTAVSEHMTRVLGFAECPIEISVSGISSEEAAKKPRVS